MHTPIPNITNKLHTRFKIVHLFRNSNYNTIQKRLGSRKEQVVKDKHTDHDTGDICSNRPHLGIAYR